MSLRDSILLLFFILTFCFPKSYPKNKKQFFYFCIRLFIIAFICFFLLFFVFLIHSHSVDIFVKHNFDDFIILIKKFYPLFLNWLFFFIK